MQPHRPAVAAMQDNVGNALADPQRAELGRTIDQSPD